ncbi:MAG: transposase [Deltaproteobacteria bacterium]|nr:transposase [Deltaproteobacteria bacterium]
MAAHDNHLQIRTCFNEAPEDIFAAHIRQTDPWNLTELQKTRLSDLEKLNLKVNCAYLFKETFRKIWNYVHP